MNFRPPVWREPNGNRTKQAEHMFIAENKVKAIKKATSMVVSTLVLRELSGARVKKYFCILFTDQRRIKWKIKHCNSTRYAAILMIECLGKNKCTWVIRAMKMSERHR